MSISAQIESLATARNTIRTKMVSAGQATESDNLQTLASNLEITKIISNIDTSDTTATAADIAINKTAISNGQFLEGTLLKDVGGTVAIFSKFINTSVGVVVERTDLAPVECIYSNNDLCTLANNKITLKYDGIYRFCAFVSYSAANSAYYTGSMRIWINDVDRWGNSWDLNAKSYTGRITRLACNAGDTVNVTYYNNRGGITFPFLIVAREVTF